MAKIDWSNSQAREMINRLKFIRKVCRAHTDCYDHCPVYAICNCGQNTFTDSMIRVRLGCPDGWTSDDIHDIVRRLLHLE